MYKLTVVGYILRHESPLEVLEIVYGKGNFELLDVNIVSKYENECRHTVIINEESRDKAEDKWFSIVSDKGFDNWSLTFTAKI